ncbi:hypothetical protein IAE22_34120, partial [Bacillus sp. S34]|nr:hypothetical protein [Bacillus sp. S34]
MLIVVGTVMTLACGVGVLMLNDRPVQGDDYAWVAGVGDHGIGMQRGSTAADAAAQDAAARGAGAGSVLAVAGDA